ncbi:hypothetical protein UFOVP53_64 [uncultured Caudovirales phage]|uniref:Uncharacterized protein n=1 Tax=uncultured Caudovirales phage TaxID=2100421 RepID=A0A6J5KUW5_9CAUD|nr:hypothetical protein UFOVP53_64 [uncultured Caudovirales phage]
MSYHKYLRGGDLHAPSQELIENNTGSTITKLKVVTLNGMGTAYPQVRINNTSIDSPFGIANEDILTGETGMVTCLGFMTEIDTSPWPANTTLYSDNSGNLTTTTTGDVIGVVIKQDTFYGIIYVFSLINFINASAVPISNWTLQGNSLTDPIVDFLGTTDTQPLKIRTDNNPVAQFDVNGNLALGSHDPKAPLHIKSYPGYTDSGLRIDTCSLTTNSTTPTSIYTINMVNNQVVRVKFQVTARQSDGAQRASFTRSALFYKQGGNVQIQGPNWQSDFTAKSSTAFNTSYSLGVSTVTFNIKPATATDTYWVGNIELEFLSSSL